jgi:hypothetical protein
MFLVDMLRGHLTFDLSSHTLQACSSSKFRGPIALWCWRLPALLLDME